MNLQGLCDIQGQAEKCCLLRPILVEECNQDKTSSMKSCALSPPTYVTLNPQLFITPVQWQSKWKAVRTCTSNNILFFSSWPWKKLLPLTFIAICRQCMGINVLMLAQLVGYGSLHKKMRGKKVCVTKQGRGGQWLQQTSLIKNASLIRMRVSSECVEEMICIGIGEDYVEKWLCTVVIKGKVHLFFCFT